MRPITAALVAALWLAPVAAQAGPVVWFRVPDVVTQRVESADTALDAERESVESARHAIVDTRGDREDIKARLRESRAERGEARRDVVTARRDLRDSWKSGDDDVIASRTRRTVDAVDRLDARRDHVRWHGSLIRLNGAELAADRAKCAREVAQLELEQSILLYRNGYRFVYGPSTYEKQVDRMERRVDARESEVEIARSVASDRRSDFVASN